MFTGIVQAVGRIAHVAKEGDGLRLAVDLGVPGIFVQRLADDRVRFVEVHAFGAAKIAGPKRWQVAQIAEAALRGEGHHFEVVFKEVRAGRDFERAAVVLGAADDDQRRVELFFAQDNAEMAEIVAEDFAGALPPVGQDAEAGFQLEVERIDDHAVGTGAADAEKVFFLFGLFERSCQAEGNFLHGAMNQPFGSAGDVPGQIQFLGEDIGGSAGEQGEGHPMAVLVGREAVDDFIEGAVTPAGDDEAAAFVGSARGDLSGVARASGFREIGVDPASGKNMASRIERATAALAPAPGVGIVNQ